MSGSTSDLSGYDEEESTALLALMIQCVCTLRNNIALVGSVSNLVPTWCHQHVNQHAPRASTAEMLRTFAIGWGSRIN